MIATRGRYALRVMIELAKQPQDHYIPLKDSAERQGISKKYLEIIVRDLVNGKLVTGISGKGGGYRLSRKPEDIPVGEVIELTEGKIGSVACLENGAEPCPRADMCETLPMWKEYNQLIHDFFYSKRLSDLAE
jgi:Rrf2 family protein